jgi:3-oxoacyl-[acyl-carrier protein] reductase
MTKLAGKVALVTGASKGIGAAIAKALAAAGAAVAVNYASSKEGADAVVAAIAGAGGRALALPGDVGKTAEAHGLVEATVQAFGRIDILVNNAGVYKSAPLAEITEEFFYRHYDINVLGLLLVSQAAVRHMPDGGTIINVSSVVSRIAPPAGCVYAGTKAAVDVMTRVLAKELGPRRIRVNAINPGLIETEGTRSTGLLGTDFEQTVIARTPLGRIGQPEEIASVAVFLASEDAAYVTGECLFASGGS